MEREKVNKTVPETLGFPYEPYNTIHILDINVPGYENYKLKYGLDTTQAQQLTIKSRYPHVTEKTRDITKRDGSPGRFSSLTNFEEWTTKERYPYVLTDNEDNLSMIVWLGPSKLDPKFTDIDPKHHLTYAIRRFEPNRRRGDKQDGFSSLTAEVSNLVIDLTTTAYEQRFGTKPLIWLSTTSTNESALDLYNTTGWKEVGREPLENGHEEVFMIYEG